MPAKTELTVPQILDRLRRLQNTLSRLELEVREGESQRNHLLRDAVEQGVPVIELHRGLGIRRATLYTYLRRAGWKTNQNGK